MATKPRKPSKTDDKTAEHLARVTELICQQIEAGANDADYVMPWQRTVMTLPSNAQTGAQYSGANTIALWLIGAELGAPPFWATYRQWEQIGGQIRQGEKASARVLRPMTVTREDDKTGDKITKTIGFTSHAVFHAGQQDGWTIPAAPERIEHPADDLADMLAAESFVRRVGAKLTTHEQGSAYYSPSMDRITLPAAELWISADAAWSTACHELTHWTGHESRLARDFSGRFGTDAYAIEELTAELGSAMTLAAIGRHAEPRPDHAQYIVNWLRVLRADHTAILAVAAKSQKACDYITSRVDMEPTRELVAA